MSFTVSSVEDSYPLTPMQQGMLFNNQFAPGTGVDIEQIVCSLQEEINVSALKKAWDHVIERHAILRTAFRSALYCELDCFFSMNALKSSSENPVND